jgi:hypothetical protein
MVVLPGLNVDARLGLTPGCLDDRRVDRHSSNM